MATVFEPSGEFMANGVTPIKKYTSSKTGLNVYFAGIDSQIINGYFCFGVDQPEASGIETLLWHLDSSGGLLPRPMRGEMLRPAWQFHGAENPLADRDQSCYVCCALGERAFEATFSCCTYLLQNLEAVFEIHGLRSPFAKKIESADGQQEEEAGSLLDAEMNAIKEMAEPKISESEVYCLSEAGEGAMAWEATLQAMFPGVRAFYNRLLSDAKGKMSMKMRECFDKLYRPENLTVIIAGSLQEQSRILDVLKEYEEDYLCSHPDRPEFEKPWTEAFPPLQPPQEITVQYVPKQPNRDCNATVCFGWRGCPATDWETALALKTLTAYLAVGPLWNKFVTCGSAHRISWCQLEYVDTCSLITIHGIMSNEEAERVKLETLAMLKNIAMNGSTLDLKDVRAMADRVGWHYVREMESEPFLVLASAISKAERYGSGHEEQISLRVDPRAVFERLTKKPIEYWNNLFVTHFYEQGTFVTKVVPKVYGKTAEGPIQAEGQMTQPETETSGEMNYVAGSRRASTRPRRKAANPVAEESNVAIEDDGRSSNAQTGLEKGDKKETEKIEGQLEELLKQGPFPFGDHGEEIAEFEKRLQVTNMFLDHVQNSKFTALDLISYETGGAEQHPQFPLNELPFFTFLEDTQSSFVYVTLVLDTSHLDETMRKYIAPITAALGAIICPRPPSLDTDADIESPNEFNLPMNIVDSQVSLGLNGEMMQSVFITLIVRPDQYTWAVHMLHYLLTRVELSAKFLRFVAKEAARGLASNYRMQTATEPNYQCFEASEINLHSLVKMIYKSESNARLFVGRRRLDLINEFLSELEVSESACVQNSNEAWKQMANSSNAVIQIAGRVEDMASGIRDGDLVGPWKVFGDRKACNFRDKKLTMEHDLMKQPGESGIALSVDHCRPSCLSMAIPINPNDPNFPKLCLSAQMFSLAQKWIWACLDEEDVPAPVLRMPCSYANLLTLNLESHDVVGAYKALQMMMQPDWPWLKSLLIATKLMVVNDPAALELGTHGAVACSLLAHLNNQDLQTRRNLLVESLKVTDDDVRQIIQEHLSKLLNPTECWYSLVSHGTQMDKMTERLKEFGFSFNHQDLKTVCATL